jgi:hypothetical protein
MRLTLDPQSLADYQRFLAIKRLPVYAFEGRTAVVPNEYADRLGCDVRPRDESAVYAPHSQLFDYQRDITKIAIEKRRFCIFADCGLGKTLIFLEFAKYVSEVLPERQAVLIVSPLMVVKQTLAECKRFYGDTLAIQQVRTSELPGWLQYDSGCVVDGNCRIGITNYEALTDDVHAGRIGALILDESSILKSHYGKWGQKCLELARGLEWKMACTGTPAPNDRIEYANHAVLQQFSRSVLRKPWADGQPLGNQAARPGAVLSTSLALVHLPDESGNVRLEG